MAKKRPHLGTAIPVRFHSDTLTEIKDAAAKIRLSDQETIRKATEMGLPILLKALGAPTAKAA